MKTLLEEAYATPSSRFLKLPVTDEEIELAIAWLRADISTAQVMAAYKMLGKQKSGNALCRISIVAREAFIRGRLDEVTNDTP